MIYLYIFLALLAGLAVLAFTYYRDLVAFNKRMDEYEESARDKMSSSPNSLIKAKK